MGIQFSVLSPPAEIDPIWRHQGAFWPYVLDAPNGSGGFDSQPPSLPPSPGLSYHTPRTPSSRHRSATPSHHSSGNTRYVFITFSFPFHLYISLFHDSCLDCALPYHLLYLEAVHLT